MKSYVKMKREERRCVICKSFVKPEPCIPKKKREKKKKNFLSESQINRWNQFISVERRRVRRVEKSERRAACVGGDSRKEIVGSNKVVVKYT